MCVTACAHVCVCERLWLFGWEDILTSQSAWFQLFTYSASFLNVVSWVCALWILKLLKYECLLSQELWISGADLLSECPFLGSLIAVRLFRGLYYLKMLNSDRHFTLFRISWTIFPQLFYFSPQFFLFKRRIGLINAANKSKLSPSSLSLFWLKPKHFLSYIRVAYFSLSPSRFFIFQTGGGL